MIRYLVIAHPGNAKVDRCLKHLPTFGGYQPMDVTVLEA